MSKLKLSNVSKIYESNVQAVSDFNIEIEDGDFVILVGPSGCGKSTTLRMIAGLEEITSGTIDIDGETVNDIPAKDRNIAMVFQDYALYPHMSVYDNIAFNLKLRKMSKEKIELAVSETASILGIEKLLNRKPKALSGGEKQRVAMGRALVRSPKIFLMDEPLSNLDAKLRIQMRAEIKKLHKALDATIIFVTHDQVEAMTLGTKIVVMKDGVIQQIDSPNNLYKNPSNVFVAEFIGSPQMNIINAKVFETKERVGLNINNSLVFLSDEKSKLMKTNDYINKEVLVGIRPENISIESENAKNESIFSSHVDFVESLGAELYVYLNVGDAKFAIRTANTQVYDAQSEIKFSINANELHFFDKNTFERI